MSVTKGSVIKCGYLKKLKTCKRKFFVLRAETSESSARLEYYDSERKYSAGQPPKRSIPLKNCFNINRRLDTKHKHVIALYTKDDCFCVLLDSDEEVDAWLKALLRLQHGEEVVDGGEAPKPTFEHVWQVTVLNRGLGNAGLTGNYRLCLTDKTLSLIKRECEVPQIELNLTNIRSCGNLRDFFFLEIGRSSTLGAGELWMQTEDNNIAQNVHSTVFHAMSTNSSKEELGPKSRNRSSSATESSKPNNMARKIYGNVPSKCHILPQDNPFHSTTTTTSTTDTTSTSDTQPSGCSSSTHPIVSGVASFYQHLRGASKVGERRHSISGSVTQAGMISHQRTQSLPLANPAPISDTNTAITNHPSLPSSRTTSKRPTANQSKCMSGGGGGGIRERCDSMPSRARTTSEGTHTSIQMRNIYHPASYHRPPSFYNRDISHSPPGGSPVSPPSVGCSTDSAGSSYSLTDETDVCTELDPIMGRYGHSLTPDEAIAEEDCPDSPPCRNYVVSDDGYVDMSPRGRHHHSPTASMSSVTSGTPSTDMRFAEYPLEKVTSYLADEDETRPTRAYSVGSRPETFLKGESLRVRALSVGSKTKKAPSRVLPPQPPQHHHHPSKGGAKSSSAPLLSNGRSTQGSHGSIGPMDDLMEMDFSRSGSINDSAYMEMKPGKVNNGYVEMKPGKKQESPYVDMSQSSSPAKPSFISVSQDYMEMDPRKNNNNINNNNNNNNNNDDYLSMSFKKQPSPSTTPDGYVEMNLGRGHAAADHDDYANMSLGAMSARRRDRPSPRPKKDSKTRSQPIAIQNTRKQPGHVTPPMHLPLEATPYASLPRQSRRRRNTNSGNADSTSCSSSSTVTTPSGSSTIFPFSPCSPPRKNDDYTPMDFDSKADYVNYRPKQAKEDFNHRKSCPEACDYALMTPAHFKPIKDEDSRTTDPPYEILRPSSTSSASSELCSSSSTIVGSRPESVNSDRIRPSSVASADVQLHYASLDLDEAATGNRSPRAKTNDGAAGTEVTLTYAAIDFVKSEGLKHNSLPNAKVKH